jgi:hypothetical protein
MADSLFVQYVTGEREYYIDDANQVNNLAGKATQRLLDSKATDAQRLSGSAAEEVRRLECSK